MNLLLFLQTKFNNQVTSSFGEMKLSDGPAVSPSDEDEVRKALVVSNYEKAVSICLRIGRIADALLIAALGGQLRYCLSVCGWG